MRAALLLLCLALAGCGDRTFTITAPEVTVNVVPTDGQAAPATPSVTVIDVAPTNLLGPPSDTDVPFNTDDARTPPVQDIQPICQKPGEGDGNGSPGQGKGQGDEKACK
jgi:hypothetical protein